MGCTTGDNADRSGLTGAARSEPSTPAQTTQSGQPTSEAPSSSEPAPTTTLAPTTTTTVTAPEGFGLVWHDEFDTDGTPDLSNWTLEHSTFGDGNNELQCYTPAQALVRDGSLTLTGIDQETVCPNGSRRQFTSAMVTSERLRNFTYGWFEIRAKVPAGQGLWPALWLSPEGDPYGPWPRSGEIDIIEIRGSNPRAARVNFHYLGLDDTRKQLPFEVLTQPGRSFADEFHTFGLIWEPNQLTWIVDGIIVHEVNNWQSSVGPSPAPFNGPFFIRMNLAIGGTFVGDPDQSTPWPATMEVDYVRVFQR